MAPFREILVTSGLDGSKEPSLLWVPEGARPSALVVGLHTWSTDRFNQLDMLPFCQSRGWALLLPEFRGPNLEANPRVREAGGSALARRDIVEAARDVLAEHFADRNAPVFLHGGSGGGHMALLTAALEDFSWTAVSSWCPITDLEIWHGENSGYRAQIEAVCGGAPHTHAQEAYRERSPIRYPEVLARQRLLLAHGRNDGNVRFGHSWRLAQQIEACQPAAFFWQIFDGGHEIHHEAAFAFFDRTIQRAEAVALTG